MIINGLTTAKSGCENLSIIEENHNPLISEGYSQLGEEITDMIEYAKDIVRGTLSE